MSREGTPVCDLMILLSPNKDGLYGFGDDSWNQGLVEIWIDSQKVIDPVGIAIVSSIANQSPEVRVFRKESPNTPTVNETFIPDMLLIERKVK